jgi:hypothetical protein
MARARSTNLHTTQTWAARMVLLGAALTVAAGVTSAVWADQAPPADARKADIATQLDQANAAQRANAPKPPGGDAVAAKAADRAARAARPPAGASLNWDRGVADTREAPIAKGVIDVTSVWDETVGDVHYSVYAGASPDDPGQGLIVVLTYTASGTHVRDEDYPAPAGAGTLHIDSAAGHRLNLTGSTGTAYLFDVDTRAFG